MHINRERLNAALQYLLHLIRDGAEYPDAEWMASARHGVPSSDLRVAYDNHCAENSA